MWNVAARQAIQAAARVRYWMSQPLTTIVLRAIAYWRGEWADAVAIEKATRP